MNIDILKLFGKTPVIFGGAIGTNLVRLKGQFKDRLDVDKLVCSEAYNLYAPDLVETVHRSYVNVGCEKIITNTFNANRVSLAEFGLENKLTEIITAAVVIARKVASGAGQKVLVSGDLGPTNKLPSLGQISFDELHAAYLEAAELLIKNGVDFIQIATCQDLLQLKTAVIACNDVFARIGRRLPIVATVTIDTTGRMLLGTELDAVLATLVPLGVSAIGLNCGLGPDGMEESVRFLAQHSPLPVAVLPNAGLPEIVDGKASYNLGPEEFAEKVEFFVKGLGVEIVGGCCGTTAEHLAAVVNKLKDIKTGPRKVLWNDSLASLYNSCAVRQKPAPLIIGERMNINGSKRFKEAVLGSDYDGAVQIGVDQEIGGAHVLDISVAYAGRNEVADFSEVIPRTCRQVRLPLCIDSTSVESISEALRLVPGRPIINSINLEDGGKKARRILELARRFGAALIALTIDEEGMAKDAGKKVEIAERLIELCAEFGINETSLFIDPLTFTLAEPKAASYGSGAQTLEAIKELKKKRPNVNTILGVSNVSYGFAKTGRKVLNSVFLHEAMAAGLDAAIVHASQIVPMANLDKETVAVAKDLIYKKSDEALDRFVKFFEGKNIQFDEISEGLSPDEGARVCLLRGDKVRITGFLTELLQRMGAKDIVNGVLLPAMAVVGKRFDAGEIPLPFVLQSAEAMRAATDFLAPHFGAGKPVKRGKVLLATVRGDVHDIGKNLVDIILSNNGFDVVNIGVKQSMENILKAALGEQVDVIGLSGLLVESALIMKGDLAEMAKRGVIVPVICGGAALTRKFVEGELSRAYGRPVYYAGDAFEGLKIVEGILNEKN